VPSSLRFGGVKSVNAELWNKPPRITLFEAALARFAQLTQGST
jgi:hypothetical protein